MNTTASTAGALRRLGIATLAAAAVVAGLVAVAPAPSAAAATTATRVALLAMPAVTSTNPGFKAAFWSPYFIDGSAGNTAQLDRALAAQKASGSTAVIIEWAAHYDAHDSAYPAAASLGLPQWNDAVPKIAAAAKKAGMTVWMGLVVAPDSFNDPAVFTNQAFLDGFASTTKKVAADLWSKYKSSIAGWYIPTEPAQINVATPQRAAQFGSYLGSVSDYLHSHLGDKPVMVSPSMPTASLTGVSAQQFVSELTPLVAASHVDVLNLQDGFEMTAWTPTQEAAAFTAAKSLVQRYRMRLWAAVYTPLTDGNGRVTVAKMAPYLKALAGTGVTLSEWQFSDYMDPDAARPHGSVMAQNYKAYLAYLGPVSFKASSASLAVLAARTPTIVGTVAHGRTVTAKAGAWTKGTALSYRWYVDGKLAHLGRTVKLAASWEHKTLKLKVVGTKKGYAARTAVSAGKRVA